jgi:hypothetical protein
LGRLIAGFPLADLQVLAGTAFVRSAILGAIERRRIKRSQAAKEAAKTRAKRQELRVYYVAKRILANKPVGPRRNCYICGRGLGDPVSIERGIGSECWDGVLKVITTARTGPE